MKFSPHGTERAIRWREAAVLLWLVLTLALAGWWLVYGLRQLAPDDGLPRTREEIIADQRMLVWEGMTLFVLLFIGATSLLLYIRREGKRSRQLAAFFSAFTHDLKTSLSSLSLQLERLESRGERDDPLLEEIRENANRLEMQLENSLLLASGKDLGLYLEEIPLEALVRDLCGHWPNLTLVLRRNAVVLADARCIECVFRNIIQNSILHGGASRVEIISDEIRPGREVQVRISDDGKGYSGELSDLGRPLLHRRSERGTGIGLYLVRQLLERMQGSVRFQNEEAGGFSAVLRLRGRVLP